MKEFIRHIWKDIQQGENIDLYLTVAVAILLTLLNILSIAPSNLITPLNLAVLSLLAFSTLGNRYRLEQLLSQSKKSPQDLFLEKFPETFEEHLSTASELWMIGMNLGRTITNNYSLILNKLRQGDKVKILLITPNSTANALAAIRTYRPLTEDGHSSLITSTLSTLCELKQVAPSNIEIRTINYLLPFGYFAVNLRTPQGAIYMEFYPFKGEKGDIPKLALYPNDENWYELFENQILTLWESASEWEC